MGLFSTLFSEEKSKTPPATEGVVTMTATEAPTTPVHLDDSLTQQAAANAEKQQSTFAVANSTELPQSQAQPAKDEFWANTPPSMNDVAAPTKDAPQTDAAQAFNGIIETPVIQPVAEAAPVVMPDIPEGATPISINTAPKPVDVVLSPDSNAADAGTVLTSGPEETAEPIVILAEEKPEAPVEIPVSTEPAPVAEPEQTEPAAPEAAPETAAQEQIPDSAHDELIEALNAAQAKVPEKSEEAPEPAPTEIHTEEAPAAPELRLETASSVDQSRIKKLESFIASMEERKKKSEELLKEADSLVALYSSHIKKAETYIIDAGNMLAQAKKQAEIDAEIDRKAAALTEVAGELDQETNRILAHVEQNDQQAA